MKKDMSLLSDAELLRLVNPSLGTAILGEYSIPELFSVVSEEQIMSTKGVGQAKTKVILAIREIANRMIHRNGESKTEVHSPKDVFDYFSYLATKPTEEIWVAILDTKNRIIRSEMVAKGTINQCLSGTREIFNLAVKRMAAAVIIAHNHPSGVSKISREDIKFTENLISGGKIIGIPVLDHVVIASEGSVSMMEEHPAMFNKKLF